ncbi:uncharacterized protein LOC128185759 [Crassostrea angulata]|uniref:uncharacterized protein LOC128185759 n=1 Tax=Magallana angulata TaxID=2784310 RepID=UPI0022B18EC4|nr:uncharacterized protein LOC128185759 [Crassostrea angulata]
MEKLYVFTFGVLGLFCVFTLGNSDLINWCRDKDGLNCWRYVDAKCLGFYEDWARENCPYRCGYCPNKPPCEDSDASCDAYHQESCSNTTTRAYMREHCRKRCNECHLPGENHLPNTPPPGATGPVPTDSAMKPPVGK